MKKVFCVIALAAICSGSVFAYGVPVTTLKTTLAADTVKKKVKTKHTKSKTKTKKDTTATKM
jgi:hypothetical protein